MSLIKLNTCMYKLKVSYYRVLKMYCLIIKHSNFIEINLLLFWIICLFTQTQISRKLYMYSVYVHVLFAMFSI